MKRTNYSGSASFLWKALLGYAAYFVFFPLSAPAFLNRLRGVKVGQKVYVAPGVVIDTIYPEAVTLEDHVYLTRGVKVIAHFNPTDPIAELTGIESRVEPVKIGYGTFVGVNALIMPGVELGRCCIVGAGAVVTKSAPEYSILGGNPAQVIGDVRNLKNRAADK